MPPPAEGIASRFLIGPALRTQPDRRLVSLVREGYEVAFEEIVRRYAKPLGRYAGAIVGSRAEDVTQEAFSKALVALRRDDDAEIDLRPWLYRIVRNAALNDLRDRPREAEALAEEIAGGLDPAEEAEQRAELTDLIERLSALPERQRAAIVMRELEGLSHEEIAAALGLSGGAARQAIHRARQSLRDGLGFLLPLPLLRVLIDHGPEAALAGTGAGVAAAGASAGGAGAGAGGAIKIGVVAAVVAGSAATGVAVEENRDGGGPQARASAAPVSTAPASLPTAPPAASAADDSGPGAGSAGSSGSGSGSSGRDEHESGDDRSGHDHEDDDRTDLADSSGPGGAGSGSNSGPGSGGDPEIDDDSSGSSGSSGSGSGSSGSGSSGSDESGSGSSGSGSGVDDD